MTAPARAAHWSTTSHFQTYRRWMTSSHPITPPTEATMPTPEDIAGHIIEMIEEDEVNGGQPFVATSFEDLYDVIDANEYVVLALEAIGIGPDEWDLQPTLDLCGTATALVTVYLQTRHLKNTAAIGSPA